MRERENAAVWQSAIGACNIDGRIWLILEGRFYCERRRKLRELGDELGISRERVRQLEREGKGVLRRCADELRGRLDAVEARFGAEGVHESEVVAHGREHFFRTVRSVSVDDVDDQDLRRLLVTMRVLGSLGIAESMWPRMSFAACVLPPAIEGHRGVGEYLVAKAGERTKGRRRRTYSSMARRVLSDGGAPLHWTEIAERCEKLGERETFSESSCFNAIQADTKTFVRVGPGTYALTAWGIEGRMYLNDLIADVLNAEGRCLEYADVLHHALAKQKVKANSVAMTLKMHPRFYRSTSGKYGLRAWLPARENQTLRTARDLIETAESLRRVRRATAKGYDVEGMVRRDRSLNP